MLEEIRVRSFQTFYYGTQYRFAEVVYLHPAEVKRPRTKKRTQLKKVTNPFEGGIWYGLTETLDGERTLQPIKQLPVTLQGDGNVSTTGADEPQFTARSSKFPKLVPKSTSRKEPIEAGEAEFETLLKEGGKAFEEKTPILVQGGASPPSRGQSASIGLSAEPSKESLALSALVQADVTEEKESAEHVKEDAEEKHQNIHAYNYTKIPTNFN